MEPRGLGQIAIHRVYETHCLTQGGTQLNRLKAVSHGTKSVVDLGQYGLLWGAQSPRSRDAPSQCFAASGERSG